MEMSVVSGAPEPTPVAAPDALLVTIDQACALLGGLGKSKTYELIASGQIAHVRVGRRRFIRRTAIDEFIKRNEHMGDDSLRTGRRGPD